LFVRPRDFDGMLGTGLSMSMYTTKTPMWRFISQLKEFLTFSVKYSYQLNYFFFRIKYVFVLYLLLWLMKQERKTLCIDIFFYETDSGVLNTSISWRFHITYNLPHLRLTDMLTLSR